jgi:CubicO group peptidase (beta-lactamase class C family)
MLGEIAMTHQSGVVHTRPYWPTAGWRTAAPGEHGLDAAALREIDRRITVSMPGVLSFLVARGGYLVFERYYGLSWRNSCHNVKSVTKSVLSALIGIAIRDGYLRGVEQLVTEALPAFASADPPESPRRRIRIKHLLTMTSGLRWDEGNGIVREMIHSPNWLEFIDRQPVAREPGERFNYSNADAMLLVALLTAATRTPALAYADHALFGPLGITDRLWQRDPQGIYFGGSELYLSPRDLAKLGYLYLNEGAWEGDQVVPADWVRQSIAQQVTTNEGAGYGYLWWLSKYGRHTLYRAVGLGGQRIHVVPDLDLVIVTTSSLSPLGDEAPSDELADLVMEAVI